MEAVSQDIGLVIVQIKGDPQGGVGDPRLLVLRGAVRVGQLVDDHRHTGHVRPRAQGVLQVAAVGEQGPVVRPAVGIGQVRGALRVVCAPYAFKASRIGAHPQGCFQLCPVRCQSRPVLFQIVQSGHKGIEDSQGLVLRRGIGQGVGIRHQNVGAALVLPTLRVVLVIEVQHILPLRLGQPGTGIGLLLVGDPHRHPGFKVQGNVPLRLNGGVLLSQGQGKHRPGVGHKDRRTVAAQAALSRSSPQQGNESGENAHPQHHHGQAGSQTGPLLPAALFFCRSGDVFLQGGVGQAVHGLQQPLALSAHSVTPSCSNARRREFRRRRSRWVVPLGEPPSPAARSRTAAP